MKITNKEIRLDQGKINNQVWNVKQIKQVKITNKEIRLDQRKINNQVWNVIFRYPLNTPAWAPMVPYNSEEQISFNSFHAPRCPRESLVPYKGKENQFQPVLALLGPGAPMVATTKYISVTTIAYPLVTSTVFILVTTIGCLIETNKSCLLLTNTVNIWMTTMV